MTSRVMTGREDQGDARAAAQPRILIRLESSIDHLPDALARIAKYIVENPEKVIRHSLADVSLYARSGQASVVRLCKEFGFDGFRELKIALAGELARPVEPQTDYAEGGASPYETVARALCKSITGTRDLLDPSQIRRLMQTLRQCVRIDLYGAAVSGIAAELLAYRLLRLGLNAHAIRDANLAHEVANGLGPGSAAIAISESGVTPDTVEFLKSARHAGAFTVAVSCRPRSPIANHADIVVPMANVDPPTYRGQVTPIPRAVLIAEIMAQALTTLDE